LHAQAVDVNLIESGARGGEGAGGLVTPQVIADLAERIRDALELVTRVDLGGEPAGLFPNIEHTVLADGGGKVLHRFSKSAISIAARRFVRPDLTAHVVQHVPEVQRVESPEA